MTFHISIRVPSGVVSSIRSRMTPRVAAARTQLVQSAMTTALADIIDHIPVETGAARADWQAEQARMQSSPPSSASEHVSTQAAINNIDHVLYLEYGTTRMRPKPTVQPALARLQSLVQSMFQFSN